ncbi:MAG: aminotransferase class V-fold PLP-dependent enzyme, partial [Candidatus Krumholzibacteriia bacterium]
MALVSSEGKPVIGKEELRRLSTELGETEAGLAWRLAALAAYRDEPLPSRVAHLWRYTDPAHLMPGEPLPAAMPPRDLKVAEMPTDQPAVLLVPGRAPELNAAAKASGLTVAPLLHDDGDAELLGTAAPGTDGFFAALNAAAWNAGVAVYVPAGKALAEPLRLLVPAFAETTLPRVLVVAGRGAELTVVEEHYGGRDGHRVIGTTELLVGQNAHVRHVLVERWEEGVTGFLAVRARVERDGSYLGVNASLGGSRLKLETGAELVGKGARSELVGVVLGGGEQRFDHHTLHRHVAGDTWSNIDFKVALTEKSRSSYTGLIRIEEDAPRSEAFQENRNLLLSDSARADTIPELEMERLDDLLDERVKIVAIGHISNVLGTVNPVAEICGRARNVGALTLVDAAQSVGHRPLTFADSGADLLVFSAHKCYGPM